MCIVHCAYTSCTSYLYLYFIAWFYSTDLRLCFHPRPINHFHSLHCCMQCLRFSMIIVPKTPPILSFSKSSSSWGFRHCLLWVRGLRGAPCIPGYARCALRYLSYSARGTPDMSHQHNSMLPTPSITVYQYQSHRLVTTGNINTLQRQNLCTL